MSIASPIARPIASAIARLITAQRGGGAAPAFRLTGTPPAAEYDTAYSWTPGVVGGVAPITFAATGTFPAGLSLNTATGEVSGTSTDVSSESVTITATDDTSAEASITRTFAVVAVVPGAPTDAVATAGNAEASVAFTAPASNGGSAITGYRVTSTPGGITATGASSPIVVPGLTNGTEYTFTVAAQNAIGYGAESAASNAVTPSAIPADAKLMEDGTPKLMENGDYKLMEAA